MKSDETDKTPMNDSGILLYQTGDGRTRVEVRLENESVWLTQRLIAELYQTSIPNINQHLTAIYEEGELQSEATIKKYLIVQTEGNRQVSRQLDHFNLDAIIAVGYRVKSAVATQFRQWATARLSEYVVKGFTMDDERLKGAKGFADYFDELLERIRDIRASEARVYQQIRNIFALASDYRPNERETQNFFSIVQNKIIFAATGKTAAELVCARSDAQKPNMGLTAWKGSVVRKQDVMTAKNYLDAGEIDILNRITVMFLDQAEFRALRRQDIRTSDWNEFLDRFLEQNELPLLDSAGSVSHEKAQLWSQEQYDQFDARRQKEREETADAEFVDDLKKTAASLEQKRRLGKTKTKSKQPRKKP
jgi:hypothetical protein